MRCYTCYFSPTGGTEAVARAVAEGWGEKFTPVDLMKQKEKMQFRSGDLCLIAVPSYGGRVPAPAVTQLELLSGNGARAVLIVAFGNRAIDDTLAELSDVAQRAGFQIAAAMEAVAQHSLVPRFGAGRPDSQDREELQGFARQIREAVEAGRVSPDLRLPGNRPYREFSGVPLKPKVSGACIGCGICAEQCPVGAIPALDPRMTDTKKCISCMHCVKVCPKQARSVSRLMTFVAGQTMKKTCSDRKPNRLYL